MELPQPSRPLRTEGRKPTHDFLSLYSHSTADQQDPSQSFQGGFLTTHDFLQPLERIEKTCAKKEHTMNVSTVERAAPPLTTLARNSPVERLLPGGIGSCIIGHISYFNHRVPKTEGSVFPVPQASNTDKSDDNSRCSSLSASGFTLWEESAVKKGKTRKENLSEKPGLRAEPPAKMEQWAVSTERPIQSSCSSFSSLSSSQPSCQQKRSFGEMLKSAANVTSKEEKLDDGKAFVIKKESSPSTAYRGDLRINVGGKCSDQKANTPRSKHSATEQRRRSKINDRQDFTDIFTCRFQKLRELLPCSDQKRDKASFLLEVIEYIQFLQEKVRKYESSPPQGWYDEPAKLLHCRNNCNPAQCYIDQSQVAKSGPVFIFAGSDQKNMSHFPAFLPRCSHNPVESNTSTTFGEADHHLGTTNKATSYPMLDPRYFIPVTSEGEKTKIYSQVAHNADKKPYEMQQLLWETRACTTDIAAVDNKLKEPEQSIEGGRISISSAYSQELLKILTQALQSSGVDMSQASIAVQIELGKRTNCRDTAANPAIVDDSARPSERAVVVSRVAAVEEDMEQAFRKKQNT
ncbi:transcription factor BIM1-like isoform X1 [Cucurbita maxima]|uniref:Transcription factor BIM1-like isoform X1 n=1 Tax=Cucurbita maxima TaxID=3661 RepID=A0A6J1KLV5_CUCMA|nr:transcription factor BIM1-like isoform X1 [Cucurbita maxima]XP_023001130.1 transcription factor BIM1-like isoform X1 [Cucurbita maxima]